MRSLLALSLLVPLAACTDGGDGTDTDDPYADRVARVVNSADGDMGAMVDSHNGFTWNLFDGLTADHDDNVFFSPFSITSALSMTLAGAEGVTETEMLDVLGATLPEADWHASLGLLTQDLSGDFDRGYTLRVANRIFGEQSYPWEQPFLDVCAEDYDAPLQTWDFLGDPEGGREEVNTWVADQTEDRIPELLPGGSVTDMTRMVLANAIYFYADWMTPFDPDDTADGTFTRLDGSTVTVPMMSMDTGDLEDAALEVAFEDDLAVLRMPYVDDEVALYALVPNEVDGLPDVEAMLDRPTFDAWAEAVVPSEVYVRFPRFEMEYKQEMKGLLADLGMPSAMSGDTADFSGMVDPSVDSRLHIDGVYHQAFLSIDELGTEAAAATAVVAGTDSAPPSVFADRPFLLVIRDDLTGAILFVGRVMDPS